MYSGYIDTGSRTRTGGTSSYLCMTGSMRLDQISSADEDSVHLDLHPVKFAYVSTASTGSLAFLSAVDSHYAVCSVCQAPGNRSWSLMVVGRRSCPAPAWSVDYNGYLMSNSYNRQGRLEYICVDSMCEATFSMLRAV